MQPFSRVSNGRAHEVCARPTKIDGKQRAITCGTRRGAAGCWPPAVHFLFSPPLRRVSHSSRSVSQSSAACCYCCDGSVFEATYVWATVYQTRLLLQLLAYRKPEFHSVRCRLYSMGPYAAQETQWSGAAPEGHTRRAQRANIVLGDHIISVSEAAILVTKPARQTATTTRELGQGGESGAIRIQAFISQRGVDSRGGPNTPGRLR